MKNYLIKMSNFNKNKNEIGYYYEDNNGIGFSSDKSKARIFNDNPEIGFKYDKSNSENIFFHAKSWLKKYNGCGLSFEFVD